jgi:hypothetical protein
MDITNYKHLFSEYQWIEREPRSNIILCSFAAFISALTLISSILLYNKQSAASLFSEDIDYFPHRNYFSAGYSAGREYSTCKAPASVSRLDRGNCQDDCLDNDAESPGPANITWSVLECHGDENLFYSEFAQEFFEGMDKGLGIEIVKRNWSF